MAKKIFLGIGIIAVTITIVGFVLPAGSELKHEIRVEAKAEKVWDVLANLENVQHYNPGVAKAAYISAARSGVGAARRCDLKDGTAIKETVIGWEANEAITMELTESPWPVKNMRWRTSLQTEGNATRVSQTLSYEMKMGPIGRILNALVMRNKMDKNLGEIFGSMKKYAESRK